MPFGFGEPLPPCPELVAHRVVRQELPPARDEFASMLRWVIEGQLARGPRPGYNGEGAIQVSQDAVDEWLARARELGVRSIICLLDDEQLRLYRSPGSNLDLISYYRENGLAVEHIPVRDHLQPPLNDKQLDEVWRAHQRLPKPVLVHCSAGCDRTGLAVKHVTGKLG